MDTRILVVCEGASECNYLVHLQRLLRELPLRADGGVPLTLIGLPKDSDPLTLQQKGVGTGVFGKVVMAYKCEHRKNPSARILVWVDDDLYVRDDKACGTDYARRPSGIPDFSFSAHNFEDFLALHFPDEQFEAWKNMFAETGHFQVPLHGAEYEPYLQQVWPHYKKAELPLGFVSIESLCNMIRHLARLPPMADGPVNRVRTFAKDFSDILQQNYPDIFR